MKGYLHGAILPSSRDGFLHGDLDYDRPPVVVVGYPAEYETRRMFLCSRYFSSRIQISYIIVVPWFVFYFCIL